MSITILLRFAGPALVLAAALASVPAADAPPAPLFQASFEKCAPGPLPEGFTALEGAWAVREEAGNRFLEIPGAPVDSYGVLFGPAQPDNAAVTLRARAAQEGQRYPAFGAGLNGAGGYRLVVAPAKKLLELFKGDELLASAPCAWESGSWTVLRLQVRKDASGQWKIEGKAWRQGAPEPGAWMVSASEKTAPPAGKSVVWGYPISGTPIQFDDLIVTAAAP